MRLLLVSMLGIIPMAQMSSAAGLGWVLYGKVVDGGTCQPLVGAIVSSPYNSNASVATNASGDYRLTLGTGAWNVTFAYTGYTSIKYSAPYETSGAFLYNASLLKPGETAATNCNTGPQKSPGYNATTTAVTTTTGPTSTISTPGSSTTVSSTGGVTPPAAANYTAYYVGAVIVIVIVIVAVALLTRKKGKGSKK